MTLSQAIADYSAFQEARGDSAAHRSECRRILLLLDLLLGHPELLAVRAEDLRGFLAAVRSRPGVNGRRQASDHTVFAYWRTVAAFFRYLETQETVSVNPMRKVPKPTVTQELIRPFSEEQVRKLLAQPGTTTFVGLRDTALMVVLLDTGVRISEALGLTLDRLDLPKRTALVLGKGRKERLVPFGVVAASWLECYLARRGEALASDRVFVNEFGDRLTRHSVARRISTYGRRAELRGVRVSPHTFRHTFGVQWLLGNGDQRGDAISLQRILGHSTSQMTQRYVNFTSQQVGELHSKLSPANRMIPPPVSERRQRLR